MGLSAMTRRTGQKMKNGFLRIGFAVVLFMFHPTPAYALGALVCDDQWRCGSSRHSFTITEAMDIAFERCERLSDSRSCKFLSFWNEGCLAHSRSHDGTVGGYAIETCGLTDVLGACSRRAKKSAIAECRRNGGENCRASNYQCTYKYFDVPVQIYRTSIDVLNVSAYGWRRVIYGNYCGRGSRPGNPIDVVDAICKNHDECWRRRGRWDCDCDRQLVRAARRLQRNNKRMTHTQVSAVNRIVNFFSLSILVCPN